MQLKIFLKSMLLIWVLISNTSIYDLHITTIDGSDKSLSDFKGKKILILVLPATISETSTQYLQTIDSLSRGYGDNINVIAVPSYEDGYDSKSLQSLQTYYRGIIGQQVIITQAMYTRISSASKQNPLFSWLTDVNQNTHFNQEVKGIGQKYFISEEGELYGVFGPEMSLSDYLFKLMIP